MNESREVKPLRAVIGERLKSLREDRGMRQEELADAARLTGLDWTRSTVAAVEAGRRSVSLEELLLLSLGYRLPLSYFVEGDGYVKLTPGATATRSVVRAKLNGDTQRWGAEDWDVPSDRVWSEVIELLKGYWKLYEWLWPEGGEMADLIAVAEAAKGEAEHSVANRFGVMPVAVSMASFGRWGRGFTAERDRRVAEEAPPDASRRTLQALRGHVSRALIDELAEDLFRVAEIPVREAPPTTDLIKKKES